jgi:tryptophan synthase beta chain
MPSPITETAPGAAIDYSRYPDASGHFGRHGGRFVAETLIGPLEELAAAYDAARVDPAFIAAFEKDLKHYVGRPSPIYHAERLSREVGGAQILLKREDLNHTGAHKINNTDRPGPAGVAHGQDPHHRRDRRRPAWRGQRHRGGALGLECVVYMGATDIERQKINVYRMKLLGATVVPVTSPVRPPSRMRSTRRCATGSPTCRTPSTSSAPWPARTRTRAWCAISTPWSAARRARRCCPNTGACRMRSRPASAAAAMPSACSMRSSTTRRAHRRRRGGRRRHRDRPPCRLAVGRPVGVLHGNRTYVICDDDGQIIETHSISAGLDYPGVAPEHAFLKDSGRAEYVGVTDDEALAAFHLLTRTEGILPALESSHAIAQAIKLARELPKDALVLCNLCATYTPRGA